MKLTRLQMAKTIVLTTYTTFYQRTFKREEAYIKFQDASRAKERILLQSGEDEQGQDDETQQLKQMSMDHKSLPKVDADRIDESEYTKVHTPKEADALLVQYFYKVPLVENTQWNFICLDEAQMVRNVESNTTSCLERVQAEHVVWTTGTVLHSSSHDMRAPLQLAWGLHGLRDINFEDYELGQLEGLYNAEYDPDKPMNEFGNLRVKGLFTGEMFNEHPEILPLFHAWCKCRQPIWLLSPTLFHKMGELMHWSVDFSSNFVRVLMEAFEIRRTSSSAVRLTLDGSEVYYPGAGIMPHHTTIVELDFEPSQLEIAQTAYEEAVKPKPDTGNQTTMDQYVQTAGPQGLAKKHKQSSPNFGAMRRPLLASTDPRNVAFFDSDALATMFPGKKQPANFKKTLSAMSRANKITPSQAKKLIKALAGDTKFGVDRITQLARSDPLAGLTHFFMTTRESKLSIIPTDPASMLSWLTGTNPMLAFIIDKVNQVVRVGSTKLLIYVDTPWLQT